MTGPAETDTTDILRRLTRRTLDYDFSVWFWGDAIALDGLLDAADALDIDEPFEHAARFLTEWSHRPITWVDHLTPGRALLRVAARGDRSLIDAGLRLGNYLLNHGPRSAGAPLYRPDIPQYRHAVWVDSIYHVPTFLAELGNATQDSTWHAAAINEWQAHSRLLGDDRQGPFLGHTYDTGQRTLHGYGWGRGVGWALYGMIETLSLVPEATPGYSKARAEAIVLAEAVVGEQDPTGFWHTLIHDRESYLESSTASFFYAALALGTSTGILPDRYEDAVERAWQATASRVDDAGEFWGVSACTYAGQSDIDDVTMYRTLPTEVNVWGQGSALRAAALRLQHERSMAAV